MTDLVRVRIGSVEKNVGRGFAERNKLQILDEPTHRGGQLRATTRVGGRPVKPKTTVAKAAAAKDKAPTPDASTPEEAQQ